MSTKISPRLGRSNVMLNSFTSCISDGAEKLSRAPEMPFSKIPPEPRMFLQKLKCSVALKQLQCLAHTHGARHFNKQMHMVWSNMQLINAEPMALSSFMDKPFTINSNTVELERVHGIFGLPHKVEGILPEGMVRRLQIHFFPPCLGIEDKAHAKQFNLVFKGDVHSHPSYALEIQKDKYMEDGNSSLCLKAEVSLPFM